MVEKHPFERVLEQISDLLKFAQDNKAKLTSKEQKNPLDPDIHTRLEEVEKNIYFLEKVTDRAISMSNLDEETVLKNAAVIPDTFDVRDKALLARAKKVRAEVEKMEKEYAAWHRLALLQKKKEKTEGKKRRKKFKRLGGQGWTPL